jgi:hypothetical protein
MITTDYWRFPDFPYKTLSWSVELTTTAASRRELVTYVVPGKSKRSPTGREIVVRANDRSDAERAAFLLQACTQILRGGAALWHFCGLTDVPLEPLTKERAEAESGRTLFHSRDIPLACQMAVKAETDQRFVYAIANVWLSYRLFSIDPMDLDPGHTHVPSIPRPKHPAEQVGLANALLLAYKALEWLELDVRASRENPSTINGQWNPKVKDDLVDRLREAGVDLNEKFDWAVRGPITKLEEKHPPRAVYCSPWSYWLVRDVEVEVVDAIAHVEWLRDKLAAHRASLELLEGLGIYEVANAQYLARRLLLEALGFRSDPGTD